MQYTILEIMERINGLPLYGGGFLAALVQACMVYYVTAVLLHYVVPRLARVKSVQSGRRRRKGQVFTEAVNSIGTELCVHRVVYRFPCVCLYKASSMMMMIIIISISTYCLIGWLVDSLILWFVIISKLASLSLFVQARCWSKLACGP